MKVKEFLKSLLVSFLIINLGLTVFAVFQYVTGDSTALASPMSDLQSVGESSGLPNFLFGQHPDAPIDWEYKGAGTLGSTALFLIDLFKYLMSGVAVIMVVVYAIKYIISGSNEEEIKSNTKGLGVAVGGLILIQLADILVTQVLFGESGEVLEDKTSAQAFAEAGTAQIKGIVGFIQFGLGAVAVLVIIVNGLRIMVAGSEEEDRKKSLKNIGIAAGGLVLVGLSEFIVEGFIFRDQGAELPSVDAGRSLLKMMTNFISGFVAILSFVVLLYAGYLYVIAGTDEQTKEKVKRLLTGAIIGILLALSAFAITNTILTFEEPTEFKSVESPIVQ